MIGVITVAMTGVITVAMTCVIMAPMLLMFAVIIWPPRFSLHSMLAMRSAGCTWLLEPIAMQAPVVRQVTHLLPIARPGAHGRDLCRVRDIGEVVLGAGRASKTPSRVICGISSVPTFRLSRSVSC
jgi:hypothetical protein